MKDRRCADNIFFITAVAGSLVLAGAGCGSTTTAIPADRMNSESALSLSMGGLGEAGQADDRETEDKSGESKDESNEAEDNTSTTMDQENKWARPTVFPGILPDAELKNKRVEIVLDKGTIVFDVLDSEAPKAASNFIALARSGFYDSLTFHRVEPGFVIQGGDPRGNGTGGPGYKFEDETVRLNYDAGIVAMANAGPDTTNGSQFFIVLENQPSLPKNYTIFGRVVSGLDVVRRVAVGDVMRSVTVRDKR